MLKNFKLAKFLKKTNSLKNNYRIFLKKKSKFQFSLQSFQRKRQDYFFFKKSLKNILQFLLKKGEKKKVFNLVKKMFFTKNNTKFIEKKNYNLYKSFYKILFSNTPYMNFLNIPPKSKKRFRGRKGRKNKKKILFLVPILPRVQKRIQATWFLKSVMKKNSNLNLTQSFLTELYKAYKSKEWMLKESSDFYSAAIQTFLRFGRKSIKLYKRKKKFMNKKKSWKRKSKYKANLYSNLMIKHKNIIRKKLLFLHKNKIKSFKSKFLDTLSYNSEDLLAIKKDKNNKLKRKKIKVNKLSFSNKQISKEFLSKRKKLNLNFFIKMPENNNLNLNYISINDKKKLLQNALNSKNINLNSNFYLESSMKNLYNLKKMNYYRPFNLSLRLFTRKNKLKQILEYNEYFNLFWNSLQNKESLLNLEKKKEEERLKKIEDEKRLSSKSFNKFLKKKIISKSLKWFK